MSKATQHIENLERLGWNYLYGSSPGDGGKRYVFTDPGGSSVVFVGLAELRVADKAAFGQAKASHNA